MDHSGRSCGNHVHLTLSIVTSRTFSNQPFELPLPRPVSEQAWPRGFAISNVTSENRQPDTLSSGRHLNTGGCWDLNLQCENVMSFRQATRSVRPMSM